jgi:hypothetical protein
MVSGGIAPQLGAGTGIQRIEVTATIMPVNWPKLITAIDAEISRLQQARKLVSEYINTRTPKRKGTMSAAGRARISAAQKKRWAQRRKTTK